MLGWRQDADQYGYCDHGCRRTSPEEQAPAISDAARNQEKDRNDRRFEERLAKIIQRAAYDSSIPIKHRKLALFWSHFARSVNRISATWIVDMVKTARLGAVDGASERQCDDDTGINEGSDTSSW
jgi:hypothetical protein